MRVAMNLQRMAVNQMILEQNAKPLRKRRSRLPNARNARRKVAEKAERDATRKAEREAARHPVQLGLVASFNRPEGNVTGATILFRELVGKQFEILHELVPSAAVVGFLVNPKDANAQSTIKDATQAAEALRQQPIIVKASTAEEIEAAFTTLSEQHVEALAVDGDAFTFSRRERVVSLAQQHSIPTIYAASEFVAAGGLVSYSSSLADAYHQAGIYVGRILNGEMPTNLPVVQPTKFELVINLKTARALGITVPQTLQVAADEVIE
jgi:putative ABC transport system substrate-binding protein